MKQRRPYPWLMVPRPVRVPTVLLVLAAGTLFFSVLDKFTISSIPTLRTMSAAFGVPMAIIWAVTRGPTIRLRAGPKAWVLAMLLAVSLGETTRVLSGSAPFAFANFMQWLQILVLGFILADIGQDLRALRYLGGAVAGAILLVGILGISPGQGAQGRTGATIINLNIQAFYYGLVCICASAFILERWRQKGRRLVVAIGLLVIAFVLLVRTGSRGGLGSGVMGLATLLALMLRRRNASAYVTLIPLAIGGAAYLLTSSYVLERIDRSVAGEDYGARNVIWAAALSMVRESPFLGAGPRFVDELGQLTRGRDTSTHNQYLQVLVGYGIVGFTVFIGLLVSVARRCWNRRSHVVGATGFSLVTAAAFMGLTTDMTFERFFWVIVALAANIDGVILGLQTGGRAAARWMAVVVTPAGAVVPANAGAIAGGLQPTQQRGQT
jgi:O-antigen ligase